MKFNRSQLLYSLMHMLFWCGYAIVWSYTAVYLEYYGYSSAVVGLVTGVGAVISVLMQPILAWMVKKWKGLSTAKIIVFLKLDAVILSFVMWTEPSGKWTVAILVMILAAIEAAIPSMLSTIAMEYVNAGHKLNYGAARGEGSIAFALFSVLLGYLVKQMPMRWLAFLYAVLSLLVLGLCLLFQEPAGRRQENPLEDVEEMLQERAGLLEKYPFLLYFLLGTVLLFMGHNTINVFLVNIIERVGGSPENLGLALAIAAAMELPIMAYFNRLAGRIDVRKLLVFSGVCFLLKSMLTWLSGNLAMIYLAQVIQIGAFGLFTPASVHFINVYMKREDSGIGQALLGAFSLGLGGAVGNVIGGFVIERFGVTEMLVVTVFLSAIGLFFIAVSAKKCREEVTG